MTTDTKAAAPRPSVISVLEAARALIAKGWCQGSYRKEDGRVCAVGALNLACETEEVWYAAIALLRESNGLGSSLLAWNDVKGRTQAEVLAAYDRAIAVERGTAPEGSP